MVGQTHRIAEQFDLFIDEVLSTYGSLSESEKAFVHRLCNKATGSDWVKLSALCDGADAKCITKTIDVLLSASFLMQCAFTAVADEDANEVQSKEMQELDFAYAHLKDNIARGSHSLKTLARKKGPADIVLELRKSFDLDKLDGTTLCTVLDHMRGTKLAGRYADLCIAGSKAIAEVSGVSPNETAAIERDAKFFDETERNILLALKPKTENENPQPNLERKPQEPESASSELDKLIGLEQVKRQVRRLTAYLAVQKMRKDEGLVTADQTLHFVFSGNPGTGKTTVARILAETLHEYGIIRTPQVVECGRNDLVAGYVGQTAIKTAEKIDSARGGVLFIDEAYALSSGSANDFGSEAIETLLKKMEDCRDDLVVIVAGYPNEMTEFLEANPGLKSRFTKFIDFPDYAAAELCRIFSLFCQQNDYQLDRDAKVKLAVLCDSLIRSKTKSFGNARVVRNIFETTVGSHAYRVSQLRSRTKEDLQKIVAPDLAFDECSGAQQRYDSLPNLRWALECPNCNKQFKAKQEFAGRRVTCNACDTDFDCPWETLG